MSYFCGGTWEQSYKELKSNPFLFGLLYSQIPDKVDTDNIKEVLVDEEAVGSVNGPGCGAKIIYRDVDDRGTLEGQARAICL